MANGSAPVRTAGMTDNPAPSTAPQPPRAYTMSPAIWTMLLLLGIVWGASFLFGRIALREIEPLHLVLMRVTLAAAALILFMLATGRRFPPGKRFLVEILGLSILNNIIPFSLILYGQKELGAGLASVINAMTPVWTLLIANWLTSDEKLTPRKIAGVVLGFAGVAVLMGGDALTGLGASLTAKLAALGATISYGFASIYGKRFRSVPPIAVATGQLTGSTILMFAICALTVGMPRISGYSPDVFWSVIAFALVCTAFAYILFFRILSAAGATNVSLVTLLVPVFAVLSGIFVLGETLSPWHVAGMVLIGLGLLVMDGRVRFPRRTTTF